MVAAILNSINYGLIFAVIDSKYLLGTDWDLSYTPFMSVVNQLNLSLAMIGHYLLVTAYFRYGMLVAPKFTLPSEEQKRD